jgi:hypothetical protein
MANAHGNSGCSHHGFHSGVGFYSRDESHIRYVMVCDDCGSEVREVYVEPYTPDPILGPGAGFLPA